MTYVQHFGQFEQTFFHGQIDEIRIWNMARTPEEIKATMNRTLVGDEPGLVGYWNFDHDGAGDLSKNSNHGTLHGDAMIMESALPDTFIPATAVALEEKVINPRYQFPMNISIYLAAALHSFSVDVTFDPSVLQVLRVKEGPFLSGDGADATWWGKPEVDNKKGIITHIACRRARRSGTAADTGILATVMFKAIHAGESKVRVQNLRLLGPNGEAIASHGRAGSVNIYPMLLANLNQAAKAEKRGVLVCEGVFSINQSMARVKFIAAAVKTC